VVDLGEKIKLTHYLHFDRRHTFVYTNAWPKY